MLLGFLGNYRGFRSSVLEIVAETNIYIFYDLTAAYWKIIHGHASFTCFFLPAWILKTICNHSWEEALPPCSASSFHAAVLVGCSRVCCVQVDLATICCYWFFLDCLLSVHTIVSTIKARAHFAWSKDSALYFFLYFSLRFFSSPM